MNLYVSMFHLLANYVLPPIDGANASPTLHSRRAVPQDEDDEQRELCDNRVLMIADQLIGNRDFWRFFGDRDLIGITIVDDRDLSDFFFPKCPSRSRSH